MLPTQLPAWKKVDYGQVRFPGIMPSIKVALKRQGRGNTRAGT